jgi:hypothetical protein
MKNKKDGKPKACRTPRIPKDKPAVVDYYNMVTEGLDIIYDLALAGDTEYTERLKRLGALSIDLAGAPETYPLASAAVAERAADLRAEAEARAKRMFEDLDVLIE